MSNKPLSVLTAAVIEDYGRLVNKVAGIVYRGNALDTELEFVDYVNMAWLGVAQRLGVWQSDPVVAKTTGKDLYLAVLHLLDESRKARGWKRVTVSETDNKTGQPAQTITLEQFRDPSYKPKKVRTWRPPAAAFPFFDDQNLDPALTDWTTEPTRVLWPDNQNVVLRLFDGWSGTLTKAESLRYARRLRHRHPVMCQEAETLYAQTKPPKMTYGRWEQSVRSRRRALQRKYVRELLTEYLWIVEHPQR